MTATRAWGAAQTVPTRGDVDGNVAHHARLIHAAAERGVQVLVFPELSLTGYELDLADELAFGERDPRLAPLVAAAVAHDMTLVVGAPVRHEGQLFIGAFILSPDRSIGLYTKHHLGAFPADVNPGGVVPPSEHSVFRPGDRNPLVRTHGGPAALAVCADTGRPSHVGNAADRGATCYLASMFVIPRDLAPECERMAVYAARHGMVVVLANYGGPTGGLAAAGGSAIWSETGEALARLDGGGAGLVIAIEGETGWGTEVVRLG